MTDTEMLDALEKRIARGDGTHVVLSAWWSGPGEPDGYSCNIGEVEVAAAEYPTLREAIWEAITLERADQEARDE